MSIKESLCNRVEEVLLGIKSLTSSDYGEVFFWQEVCSMADKSLKQAWAAAQNPKGKIKLPSDEGMRGLGVGEHVVTSSKLFTVTAKIAEPRKQLDMEMFTDELVRRFKIQPEKITALIELCKKPTQPALTKRIVENVR